MKKSKYLLMFLVSLSSLSGNELLNCRKALDLKVQEIESARFKRIILLNPQASSWIKAAKSYSQAFQLSEPLSQAPKGSAQSFLYFNALESCSEFKSSFDRDWFKYQGVFVGAFVGGILLLGLVIFLRFR